MIQSLRFALLLSIWNGLFVACALADTATIDGDPRANGGSRHIERMHEPLQNSASLDNGHRTGPVGMTTKSIVLAGEDQLRDLEQALKSREQQEPERKRLEQQQKNAEEQRKKEEDANLEREEARLVPICRPLQNSVLSILKVAGTAQGSFEQAQQELLAIEKKLPTSCPSRVTIFNGSIAAVIRCYNNAFLIKLTNGEQFVGTKETLVSNGFPQRAGERVLGITDEWYACILSTTPLSLMSALRINAVVRQRK